MVRLILFLCLGMALSGCASPKVRFADISPYSPVFRRAGWVAIVHPEVITPEFVTIHQASGGFMARSHKVYWQPALDVQANARFRRCFEGGAIGMDEGEAVEMERIIQAARGEGASPGIDARAWREAVDRARSASTIDSSDPAATSAGDNALTPPRVVIRLTEPTLAFVDRRPVFRMRAIATEPLTTRVLLDEPYSAQGRILHPRNDSSAFSRDIHETVSDAINGTMIALARDIDAELGD